MARRTFDVIDVTEILVHWHAGRSLSEMSQSLGVDRKTIRKYVAPAAAAGIAPGGPAKSEGEWQDLVREWFPELSDTRLRQVTWPAIAAHHDYIAEQLKAGVRMSTIHQRLTDEHVAWLRALPVVGRHGGYLMKHSDTTDYLEWG